MSRNEGQEQTMLGAKALMEHLRYLLGLPHSLFENMIPFSMMISSTV
jgi:hypothetical protein